MLTRRSFVGGMAAAGTLAAISPKVLFANPINQDIGIQLYTIREEVRKDFQGSLKKLSSLGFTTIETADYTNRQFYGQSPADFKKTVLDLGLNPLSCHLNVNLDTINMVIEDARNAGLKYIVIPWIPEEKRKTLDDYMRLADELNKMGAIARREGMKLGYHNHAFEFNKIEDKIPYDLLLQNTSPENLFMELDTYWVVYGGYNPIDYFSRYPGRFELWHVKDMAEGKDRESTEIGSGTLDFPGMYEKAERAGMEYIFLEQEHFNMDPWSSLEISIAYLKKLNH